MRTKKSVLIFLTDVIPLIIVSTLGIFKLKIFLQVLGNEVLGLYQLFSQIMVYIALVDGGLSTAVLHALYKPNAEKDEKTLYSILLAARKVFSLIGTTVFLIATLIAFIVPLLIKDYTFDYFYIVISFIIYSLSNVIAYFFVPSQVCLEVKEKKYIVNLLIQGGQIVQSILEIIMLLNGFSFISVLVMHSIIKLISNVLIGIISYMKYKNTYKDLKPNYEFIKQLKHLIFHKINGLVGSNIDVLIISKLLGLVSVAVYSSYYYIYNMLRMIIGKFSSSSLAIIGNYIEKEKDQSYGLFKQLNNMMFFIAIAICVPLTFAISSFIDIWYEGQIITSFVVGLAFSLLLYIEIIKQPTVTFVSADGLFKETKFCAIVDTVTNLSLSLLFVSLFGMPGVLFATIIAILISEYILKTNVIYKKIFNHKSIGHFIYNTKFFVITFVDLVLGYYIFKNIVFTNIFEWFLMFIIYSIVNALVLLGAFYITKSINFIDRIKVIFERGKK